MSSEYVLGHDQEELQRLQLQHQLWKDDLLQIWAKAHMQKMKKVLDLGCGPGFTTLDLAQFITGDCHVTAVDLSEPFLKHLQSRAEQLPGGKKISTYQSYIEKLDLPERDYEGAFCRWLMIFVQDPKLAIERIRQHLQVGAYFSLQEYVSYDSMNLVPHFSSMKPVVEAIFKSWRDQGGDPNRGQVLPQLLEKGGFEVVHIAPVAKFARPQDPLWAWPDTFYKSFLPRLLKNQYLSQEQVHHFNQDWARAKNEVGAYFIAPTVINIVACKR